MMKRTDRVLPKTISDLIKRIELRLSLGEVARGLELLRELVDERTLEFAECEWAMQSLRPYGEEHRIEGLLSRMLELKRGFEPVQLMHADFLRESGRFQEAESVYRQVLQTNPTSGHALYYLASINALREEDVREFQLDLIPSEDQVLRHFAIGKLAEDSDRFETAMTHFDLANHLASQIIPPNWKRFDLRSSQAEDDWIRAQFSKAFLNKWYASGLKSDRSIFVVGMPRSGTTLLERILAGHPGVHAAGELSFWTQRAQDVVRKMHSNPQSALPLAQLYERLLETIAPSAHRVVNKNPMNAKLVGALHILFPNARFVWCSRHPVDHCLSMFKTFGGAPKDMAFSKRNLVDGYRLNEAMKEHWQTVIPSDRFMEITYEQLVTNNEATTTQVVNFCGLDWSDQCVKNQSRGSVRTPSAWQVRQPIYTSSLNSWRRYEPWLAEFRELL